MALAASALLFSSWVRAQGTPSSEDLARFLPPRVGSLEATRDPGLRHLPVPGFYRAEAQQYYALGSAIVTITLYDPADRRFVRELGKIRADGKKRMKRGGASHEAPVGGFDAVDVEGGQSKFAFVLVDVGGGILVRVESNAGHSVDELRAVAGAMDLAGLARLLAP